jgi:hypothetical protein
MTRLHEIVRPTGATFGGGAAGESELEGSSAHAQCLSLSIRQQINRTMLL